MNYGMPMMPINPNQNMMMNNSPFIDIDNRLAKIERQIKRLDQRLTRLETPYTNNNNNFLEDDNSMYMM